MARFKTTIGMGLIGLSLIGGSTLLSTPADAAAKSYHIKNSTDSKDELDVYTNTTCSYQGDGSYVRLSPGKSAKSTGWKSFWTSHASESHVTVYSGSTGSILAYRHYYGECVKAYTGNDYLIVSE